MPDSKAESDLADKFRELARDQECADDEAAFGEAVRKVGSKAAPQEADE